MFGLGGNILVNSGRDGVLIVDDQFPQLKNKIMRAIRKVGGKKIDYIVNSHWHFDHAEGNLAFGKTGSKIIAHENSRYMMINPCLLYTSPSPRDATLSRMPSSA